MKERRNMGSPNCGTYHERIRIPCTMFHCSALMGVSDSMEPHERKGIILSKILAMNGAGL